ncbi:MAG TPA: glycosyltransferase family 39 protein [Chitinophagales bacterium]|nr:glycosyltransferase family 39 protein [Chitinophagales bacterium]
MAHHFEQRNAKEYLKTRMDNIRHHFMRGKYPTGFTAAFILVLPNLAWIILDKGVWRGDPVGYALNSMALYLQMITDLPVWKWNLFHGYKAPLIFWIGQFLIPMGSLIGSINFSLLLIPFIAAFISLMLLFRSFDILFNSKAIALCGSLLTAASPLFIGLSTQFWIEPLQVALTSWFIYIMIKVKSWNFYFALSQFIIALSLAMLIKVSSPLYIIVPAIVFWMKVYRSFPTRQLNRKNLFFLLLSLLFFFPAGKFYFNNYRALLDFAHYAGTSPLFGSDESKYYLWIKNIVNGIFLPFGFCLSAVLLLSGIIRTIKLRAYGNFDGIFLVALLQISVFFIAWIKSSNVDPRYFLPALPYFTILVCWGVAVVNSRMLAFLSAGIFLIQLAVVNGYAFGLIQFTPAYGMIRPVMMKPNSDMRLLQDIMPLATRDSSIIFDLNPELGVAEFQYELAKQKLYDNWQSSSVDIGVFFNVNIQVLDTGKIDVETVWKNVLAYQPVFYITWKSRLSPALAKQEMQRIDKYNAATVPVRWAVARKIKDCGLYEVVPFASYPQLLVYKLCNVAPR